MDNLNKHIGDVNAINEYINLLLDDESNTLNYLNDKDVVNTIYELNEQFEDLNLSKGLPYNTIKLLTNLMKDKSLEGVILDKLGNPIASVEKDEVELDTEEEEEEEEDVFGRSEEDKELIKRAKQRITATDALLALSLPAGATTVTRDGTILKGDNTDYETVKIFFKGNTTLSVIVGGGVKVEEIFSGFIDFTIQTIKKTGKGYIMNLYSQKMRKDSSLLLYVKNLSSKPQTNLGQIAYNKGKFIGDPKQLSFEIVKIK